jgi:hypothetical protein
MSTAAAWKGFLPKTGVYWQELFFADPNLVISFRGMGLPSPQETPHFDVIVPGRKMMPDSLPCDMIGIHRIITLARQSPLTVSQSLL